MSDLYHPRKQQSRANFYPLSATIKKSSGDANEEETDFEFEDVLVGKACQVAQSPGNKPGTFENEPNAKDSVLFQECWPEIISGMVLVVPIAGVDKWFKVLDVSHIARATQTFATLQAR